MTGPAYRTISDVATIVGVPQHVLRFWETKFPQIAPLKRGGNRRYYRPEDIAVIERISRLLHDEGYTIKGVQKLFATAEAAGPDVASPPSAGSPTIAARHEDGSAVPLTHAVRDAIQTIRRDLAAALSAASAM